MPEPTTTKSYLQYVGADGHLMKGSQPFVARGGSESGAVWAAESENKQRAWRAGVEGGRSR
jgi:hypothetical protein